MSKKTAATPLIPASSIPAVETLSLDSLVVDPANVRLHGDKNRQTLDASLRRFGAARSIVVDARGVVRAGNGTLEAARAAGMTDAIVVDAEGDQLIVVRRKDWSPTEATAYAIADNRSSDLAEDDPDALARTLQALMDEGFDLAATGFSEEEANALIEGLGSYGSDDDGEPAEDPGPQIDRAAELQERWGTATGQLWLLPSKAVRGKEHRLLCGDCRNPEDVSRLMGGTRAAIGFTSPPYNAGQRQHLTGSSKRSGEKYTTGISDDIGHDEYLDFLVNFTSVAITHCEYLLVNLQSLAGNKVALIDFLHHFRSHIADVAVWTKPNPPPAMEPKVMNSAFEFVFAFTEREWPKKHIGTADFRGTVSNVISGPIASANDYTDMHNATFPVYLPAWAIESFTNIAEVVLEPFAGTGTTIVAAEQAGRICHAIEISPKYVAVALERLMGLGLVPYRA